MKSFKGTNRHRLCKLVLGAALALVAGTGCGGVADEDIDGVQAAVGSTWPTPVPISNLQGLWSMDPAGNYYLTADIDGGGATWSPPPFFMGTLDGKGKTIKNFKIEDRFFRAAGFFESAQNALIKNLRFTGMTVKGTNIAGGVVGVATGTTLDKVGFQGTVEAVDAATGLNDAGGLVGQQNGGTITRSYMKGTVQHAKFAIGGLAARAMGAVTRSYAQATVTGLTSNTGPSAGGVVGVLSDGGDVHDVYAVGNVRGSVRVGGVIGWATCSPGKGYFMYNGIYRGGDLSDATRSGGWSGGIGVADTCTDARWGAFFYDTTSDPSTPRNPTYISNYGYSAALLREATTPDGGVYCQWSDIAGHCLDNGFADPPWNAGTATQHHTLRNILDTGSQPL